jgi:cyclopropane fatty-acyl-phospholipid synthase-like methyltransferase
LKKRITNLIFTNDLVNVPNHDNDLIISLQSIEHVDALDNFLEQIKSKLKKKGLFYLETPNCNKNYFELYKQGYFPHTYFLNKKSINEIANKFNFKVLINESFQEPWSELINIKKTTNEEGHNLRVLFINN